MIGGCLRSSIRRARIVRMCFRERSIGRTKRAVHLVGRDMVEAVRKSFFEPHGSRSVEKDLRSNDIRRNELARTKDRAVDVRLCCEMNDRVQRFCLQEIAY